MVAKTQVKLRHRQEEAVKETALRKEDPKEPKKNP